MKTLTKFAALLAFAVFTSTAYAEPAGEAQVRAAAEGTVAKIEEAVALAEKHGDKAEIVKAINDARQLQKEFRYEITERSRQKANDKLRISREAFEAGETESASTTLKAALAIYQEMLKTYNANH
jgi:large subunit ribosomal protein L7/L12